MAKKEAFFTIKDHKEDFETNPKYRLINPSKSELGKVSKQILDDINSQMRNTVNVNQWKNNTCVIEWFKNIRNKPNHTFLSFDIAEFYWTHQLLKIYSTKQFRGPESAPLSLNNMLKLLRVTFCTYHIKVCKIRKKRFTQNFPKWRHTCVR